MWNDMSGHAFATSCLHRIDDCFSHDSSTCSPKVLQNGMIQGDSAPNVRAQYPISPTNFAFQTREMNCQRQDIEHDRLHNAYKSFLNMDRVMPWMSSVDHFPSSGNSPQQCDSLYGYQNPQSFSCFQGLQGLQGHPSHQSSVSQHDNSVSHSVHHSEESKYLDSINLLSDQHSQLGINNFFSTSPVKSDASTATPTSIRSLVNDNFLSYQNKGKLNIQGYFSAGINGAALNCVNSCNFNGNIGGNSDSLYYYNSNNGYSNCAAGNAPNFGFGGTEHYRLGDVPPLSFSCFDKSKNEAYFVQASNLLKILSPSWILCIDIAAILLTNTDNKMALSNIGPKLSCFARDALRQIKQKKLSRFIREHGNFFDIRRPSPTHSALYVTLKFPLPDIIQQFLPSIVQLRKFELERNQMSSHLQEINELSENKNESSKNTNVHETELTLGNTPNSSNGKLNLLSEMREPWVSQSKQKLEKDPSENFVSDDRSNNHDCIPVSVKSYQAYECWLCVREFANVLIHQPTCTMELREIGVLMSQKAKILAKRNSSKKNYKSFLLSYPRLFRIFGKDDNHSIQWIGSNQDFIRLNSIKYQPSQTDDQLFNVTDLKKSHSQFLFSLKC